MRYLSKTLVLVVLAASLGISGCNSNTARNAGDYGKAGHYATYSENADLWDRVRGGMWLDIPDNNRVEHFVR